MAELKHIQTEVLEIAFEESGDPSGPAVVLLHGFPYDVRAYDSVIPPLAERGAHVIVPHLRGFGPTCFRYEGTMRSGQQAAIGHDLLDLLDALDIDRAVVAGYDWGGRAACIVAALWPERVSGLVSVDGYNVQDIAASGEPALPEVEASYWYQYYFHAERGRRGLERNRESLCALLWRMWSPTWSFTPDDFARSAPSLHNSDFVDVVVHSYRHRYGLVPGDARYDETEARIAARPAISVPTVVLESGSDGVGGRDVASDRPRFTGPYRHELLPIVGHNVPQEAPVAFGGRPQSPVRRTMRPAGARPATAPWSWP